MNDLNNWNDPPKTVFVTWSSLYKFNKGLGSDPTLYYHTTACQVYHDFVRVMMEIDFTALRSMPGFDTGFARCKLCASPELDNRYSQGRYAPEYEQQLSEEKIREEEEIQ